MNIVSAEGIRRQLISFRPSSCPRKKGMAVCIRAKSLIPALFFLTRHGGHARGVGVDAPGIDLCLRDVSAIIQADDDGHECRSRCA